MKKLLIMITLIGVLLVGCSDLETSYNPTTIQSNESSLTTTEPSSESVSSDHQTDIILERIDIDESTVLDQYELGHISVSDIKLNLIFNHGYESSVYLNESMIVESLESFNEPGSYTINVHYLSLETQFIIEIVEGPDVIGISVDETSFNPYGLISSYDASNILINLELENGEISQIPLDIEMIDSNDYIKFFTEGFHEITVRYKGFETTFNIALTSLLPEENPLFNPTGQAAIFYEVFDLLYDNHFKEPSIDLLYAGATQGMIDALEDQFTSLFDEQRYSSFYGILTDTYIGTGIIPAIVDETVIVGAIIEGSPADLAGILVDDIILSINEITITVDNISEIYQSIIGESNIEVLIQLERLGVTEPLSFTLITTQVSIEPVQYEIIASEGLKIGYISVSNFTAQADDKFEEALTYLESENIDRLIIDLRNNGGGFLSTVTNMLELLLIDDARPIFQMQYRNNLNIYYGALDEKKPYEIVTLVNERTASASEIFASSMQEHGDYLVIGETTYGKGIAQITKSLKSSEDMYLHISNAKWLTADGNWIHQDGGTGGVVPNIIVEPNGLENASKIYLHNNQQLTYDSFSQENMDLQIILNGMGYDLRTDGYYDLETKLAIEDIQSNNGLEVTGNADVQTIIIINAWLDHYQSITDTQLDYVINYFINNIQPE